MRAEVMTITPEIAGDWLAKNTHNRKMSERAAKDLAKIITEGQWVLNGESIIIGEDGVLVDGQHRLAAIIMANKAVESVVVFEAEEPAYETVDTGKRRNLADALYVRDEANPQLLANVAGWQWRFDNNYMHTVVPSFYRPTHHQLIQLIDSRPELRSAAAASSEIRGVFDLMPKALAVFLRLKFSEHDADRCEEFFEKLATGARLDVGNPVLQLRERLAQNRAAKAKLKVETVAALTIKAYNAFCSGVPLQLLTWRYDEPFPTIGQESRDAVRVRKHRAPATVVGFAG